LQFSSENFYIEYPWFDIFCRIKHFWPYPNFAGTFFEKNILLAPPTFRDPNEKLEVNLWSVLNCTKKKLKIANNPNCAIGPSQGCHETRLELVKLEKLDTFCETRTRTRTRKILRVFRVLVLLKFFIFSTKIVLI
jgi:hypothetical protein